MPYAFDTTADVDLDGYTAPATFSVYQNDAHPDDLPSLTLECVKLGQHVLNREAVIAWVGAADVAWIERNAAEKMPDEAEEAACYRADAWRKENGA